MKIAVIGAGWYGCHIALALMAEGYEVTVYERNSRPLHEASGNNQFRLHRGFHYPRHYLTRIQSRDGFVRFNETYPELSAPVEENIYAVASDESLLDFETYKAIMRSSGIEFQEIYDAPVTNIDGAILTDERVLLIEKARQYFIDKLGAALRLDCEVKGFEELDEYDYVVDATWGHFYQLPISVYYEPTILLYYGTAIKFPAITLVDGPLCSVYPTEDPKIYTLSSVTYTPVDTFDTFYDVQAAQECKNRIDTGIIENKRQLMESQIRWYMPGFNDIFSYTSVQLSIKTKPYSGYANRSCYVFRDGRVFSVMSGKIDTIFFAADEIKEAIRNG